VSPNPTFEQTSRAERLIDLIAPKLQMVEEELRRNFQSNIRTISDVGEHILGPITVAKWADAFTRGVQAALDS